MGVIFSMRLMGTGKRWERFLSLDLSVGLCLNLGTHVDTRVDLPFKHFHHSLASALEPNLDKYLSYVSVEVIGNHGFTRKKVIQAFGEQLSHRSSYVTLCPSMDV